MRGRIMIIVILLETAPLRREANFETTAIPLVHRAARDIS